VESDDVVCLANGARVPAKSGNAAGTSVAVILRPERAHVGPRGETQDGRSGVDGVIRVVTYLGNSIVYRVGLDWMELDVREENKPGSVRYAAGDEIRVSWREDAIAVVAG